MLTCVRRNNDRYVLKCDTLNDLQVIIDKQPDCDISMSADQSRQWVMGQMGFQKLMGHMGHGLTHVDS
jgi:hypothetical protein